MGSTQPYGLNPMTLGSTQLFRTSTQPYGIPTQHIGIPTQYIGVSAPHFGVNHLRSIIWGQPNDFGINSTLWDLNPTQWDPTHHIGVSAPHFGVNPTLWGQPNTLGSTQPYGVNPTTLGSTQPNGPPTQPYENPKCGAENHMWWVGVPLGWVGIP